MNSGTGVWGLSQKQVVITGTINCVPALIEAPDGSGTRAINRLLAPRLYAKISSAVGTIKLGKLQLPSARFSPAFMVPITGRPANMSNNDRLIAESHYVTRDGDKRRVRKAISEIETLPTAEVLARLYAQRIFGFPDGIISFDPTKIISPGQVYKYQVLPKQAGLSELIEQGALMPFSHDYFLIQKTFPRFPAGLVGQDAVRFILGKGVRIPDGNPGDSRVVAEKNGRCKYPKSKTPC